MIAYKVFQRELKNNKKYWIFFTANLCIGLVGFTFIYLFRANLSRAIEIRAKTILSAELAVSGRRDLSTEELVKLNEVLGKSVSSLTSSRELYSMGNVVEVSELAKSRLLLIKAVESNFPLIGEIRLKENGLLNADLIQQLQEKPFVILAPELLTQMEVKVGDSLKLGNIKFQIFDSIESDSTSSLRGISLAPKVYIGNNFLDKTGLIAFGTVAYYSRFYKFKKDSDPEKIKKQLFQFITDPGVRVQTSKDASKQLGRVSGYVTNYLGLIGVVALLMSCVGGSYLFRSYLLDRLKQIGAMRAVGVSTKQIYLSFIFLVALLGAFGTFFSLIIGIGGLSLLSNYLREWISFPIEARLNIEMILVLLSLGVAINILMSYPLMKKIFKTKISSLLNNKYDEKYSLRDIADYLPLTTFIWGISCWQAKSFFIGSLFFGIILFVFLLIGLLLPLFLKLLSKSIIGKKISLPFSLSFGFGMRNFTRNHFTTVLLILSLSIGGCLINVIGQVDHTLKSQLVSDTSEAPSLFLFDIQDEQKDEIVKYARENGIAIAKPTPMIRARLIKKKGELVSRIQDEKSFETVEDESERRINNRGVNLTFDSGLNKSESLVEGRDFSNKPYDNKGLPEISLEKSYARRLGVEVGDTLTYDILGLELQAKIVNLRSVRWTSFLPNFFIKFQPGVLEDAPKTYLSVINKVSLQRQIEIQNLIVDKFPSVSIVNVTDVMTKALGIFEAMGKALGIMSLCCIGIGIFVLFSILQSQMFKKNKEFALQKINGMSKKQIFRTILWEYLLIIFLSLLFSVGFGLSVSYIVSYFFLDGEFAMNKQFILLFCVGLIVLSSLIITATFKANYSKRVANLL